MKIDAEEASYISREINAYLTPYAFFLVVMGAVSAGLNLATGSALAIIVFTGIGNVVLARLIRRNPDKLELLRTIRICFNYAFNIFLVMLLWPVWPPIWMLLLLSICTISIFEDRKTTMITASLFTIVLFSAGIVRGEPTWASICELITRIVTLWVTGLFINRLKSGLPDPPAA